MLGNSKEAAKCYLSLLLPKKNVYVKTRYGPLWFSTRVYKRIICIIKKKYSHQGLPK